MTKRHPIQPLVIDDRGTLRFKENAIVVRLLDYASARGMDMNAIAIADFTNEDREQFAQLIGYSADGFMDLRYATPETYDAAMLMHSLAASECEARLASCQRELKEIKNGLREPIANLYHIHPDDLK